MGALERTIARAGRRAALDQALLGAGRGLAIGVCGGLILLALDRGTTLVVPVLAYPLLAGVAVAAAIIVAVMRRPTALEIAVRLDRRLGLRDRLGTGVAINAGQTRGDLAELAGLDAQRVAATVNVRPATPIRVTGIWPVAIVLGALLTSGVLFLPAFGTTTNDDPAPTRAELEAQRKQIVQTIDETLADLDDETLETASREDVETLERLAEQLAEPAQDEVELARLRDESAAQMEEMADRLAEDSRRNLEVVEEVTRRFAGAEETIAPSREPLDGTPAELDEFVDAMRRGRLDEAAEKFDGMLERRDELPAPAQEDLARELRELARQVDPQDSADGSAPPDAADLERLREALEDLGVDEQAMREMLNEQDTARRNKALDKALEEARQDRDKTPEASPGEPRDDGAEQTPGERGADEETRRRLAEDLAAAREKRQVREQADERGERLAEALEKAADEIDGRRQEQQQQQPGAQQGEQPVPRPGESGEPRSEQGEQGQQGEQGEQGMEQPGETPGEQPGEAPTVSELLRRMRDAQQHAKGKQADSERLREAARRLADTMTDEQKRQLVEQWMQMQGDRPDDANPPPDGIGNSSAPPGENAADHGQQRGSPPPPAFEDLDLRGEPDEQDQRIIDEWLSDAPVEGAPTPAGPGDRAAAVSRARSAAEQAIEKSVVPSRYHDVIRRYFGRLEKTADPPPPAKPAAGDDTQ